LIRGDNPVAWNCYDCTYPACSVRQCGQRPRFPITNYQRQLNDKKAYHCDSCSWPQCAGGCGSDRPREYRRTHVTILAEWFCANCKTERRRRCTNCELEIENNQFTRVSGNNFHEECQTCEMTKTCKKCRLQKPANQINHLRTCTDCTKQICVKCGKRKLSITSRRMNTGSYKDIAQPAILNPKRCFTC
jgi:hypothetical protein